MNNKYLEKIAEGYSEDESGEKSVKRILGGYLGSGIAATAISTPPALAMLSQTRDASTPVDKSLLKRVLRNNKDLDVTFRAHKATNDRSIKEALNASRGAGPHAYTKTHTKDMHKNYVNLGKYDDSIIYHELGHVRDMANPGSPKMNKVKVYSDAVSRLATSKGLGAMAGAGLLASEKTRDNAYIAPLALGAPMLRSEMAANIHGYNMLRNAGAGSSMKNRFLRTAALNTLNYGGLIGGSALGVHAVNKISDRPTLKENNK